MYLTDRLVTKIDISDRSLMINDQNPAILMAERTEIIREVAGKNITVIHYSTPFGVDVIATFIRCVEELETSATVLVRLVDLYFAMSSVNSSEVRVVLSRALGVVECSLYKV